MSTSNTISRELFRSPSAPRVIPETPYAEKVSPYKNVSFNKNIKNAISTLVDYVTLKHSSDSSATEQRINYLKEAIEEIEKEIREVQRLDGGVRHKRRRTHKRAVRRNRTRARK